MGDPRTPPRGFLGRPAAGRPVPQRLCLAAAALLLLALAVAVRGPPSACLWGLGRAQLAPAADAAATTSAAAAVPAHRNVTSTKESAPPTSIPREEVPPGCLYLERACLDQGQIVMTDFSHQPQAVEQQPLPWLNEQRHYNFPTNAFGSNPDAWAEDRLILPPVYARVIGELEPTPDLQHPRFDSRTVPLILVPEWQENYGHTLGNSAAWLHAWLHARNVSDWVDRLALVVHTPLGMALPKHWRPLVGPLVPAGPIETLADFSARLPPEGSGCSSQQRSRCFAEALLCAGSWEQEALNISQAAQTLVRLNEPLPPSPVTYPKCRTLGNGSTCLRVLFLTRSPKPAVRQVMNIDSLLAQCNSWSWTDSASNKSFGAACTRYHPSAGLKAAMAAVRSADVIIGSHGATMANAFFARPGSAMMEIFSAGWTWQVHRIWLEQDPLVGLQWWGLTVEDESAFSPGELESLYPDGHPGLYIGWQGEVKRLRDRNLRVPWAGLDQLLQEYAAVQAAGGMPAYRQRRESNQSPVHYKVVAGGKLVWAGTGIHGGAFGEGG